ncbi:MAG: DNA polymerase III subunit delta [Candidatus Omnitrophica bacterium CG1_02_49_10]|nr:MAG: DNA polymerase III subunit delta [Candidatus Omnitrophica bacterium CG1_02_49_10]
MVSGCAYLFSGPERFLKDEALRRLKKDLLKEAAADLNYDEFDADGLNLSAFFDCLKTAPFISCRRMTALFDIERLNKAGLASLISYLKKPSHTTILVIVSDAPYLNKTLASELKPYVKEMVFRPLGADAVPKWISDKARLLYGKNIENAAARLIADNLGNDLALISGAIEQLCTYVGEEKRVTSGDVKALIGRNVSNTAFELVESVGKKDKSGSLKMLDSLIEDGKSPAEIIGAFGWHLIRLKRGKVLLETGFPRQELVRKLSIRRDFADRFLRQVDSLKRGHIDKWLKKLLYYDMILKRSRLKASIALESLVVELCT